MGAKEEIKLTIFRLIHERGYDKTTYQAIADMSGHERTLIQYHFPQKSLFMILYIDFLVSVIINYLSRNKMVYDDREQEFIISSKIYTQLLLHKDISSNVTSKVVTERKMLTKIQDVHEKTAIEILGVNQENREEFLFLLRFAQGGHFDILYRMINEDYKCDVHRLLTQTLLSVSPALNISQDDVYKIMNKSLKFDERIQKAVEKIIIDLKSQLGIVSFS